MLDDGRITDAQGRTVDFKNTIIIMTSNIGSDLLLQSMQDHAGLRRGEVKSWRAEPIFSTEFLNRLDEVILFHPLSKENMSSMSTYSLPIFRIVADQTFGELSKNKELVIETRLIFALAPDP